ncbi:hypothetical protein [Bacillus sp. M6-12]|uniref:hypothetical protein n=1 Tax=Bacillus sp. M6-12 TaxID=2054166 RepID=UPI0015E105B2|nr:hypothetical protein [Bacillus sp. M6-12]
MKFTYFNDTGRIVTIHPATFSHGCTGEDSPIKPLEERTFILPEGAVPWVKMWDYSSRGGDLQLLVSPQAENEKTREQIEFERDKNRAYELLKQIYENNFIVTNHLKAEVHMLLKPNEEE